MSALNALNAAGKLRAFADATGCDPLELSADDGKSLDLLRVLDAMRKRGYTVGVPVKPQAPQHCGHTIWLVTVSMRGARVTLRFQIQQDLR
ncbi:acetolactate synthase regulatory subunit [Oxalobacteraceae bacterium GrIS 1.11]